METREEKRLRTMNPGAEWSLLKASSYASRSIGIYRSQYALNKWIVVTMDYLGNETREIFSNDVSAWRTFYSLSMAELENEGNVWFREVGNNG